MQMPLFYILNILPGHYVLRDVYFDTLFNRQFSYMLARRAIIKPIRQRAVNPKHLKKASRLIQVN